jgi:hypothetical protein
MTYPPGYDFSSQDDGLDAAADIASLSCGIPG